jgi:lysyl-tRNA synthetase class 2
MRDAIEKHWPAAAGKAPDEAELSRSGGPRSAADRYNQAISQRLMEGALLKNIDALSDGELTGLLFETMAESKLIQPTLLYDFPTDISPLSKVRDDDPALAERFEVYVAGMELGNAFSELNDSDEQERRFEEQVRRGGEEVPREVDMDYVRALAHGLPPTAGMGIGIDRLTMLLTDSHSIREVILFPLLRPETADIPNDSTHAPEPLKKKDSGKVGPTHLASDTNERPVYEPQQPHSRKPGSTEQPE